MELNVPATEGDDNVPLSLMSKFCDSRLKELSEKSTSESAMTRTCLFSDIFAGSSTYKPKRREHCTENSVVNEEGPVVNCSDFGDPHAQQLCIDRHIPMSKHIKSPKLSEFTSEDTGNENDINQGISYNFNTDINGANSLVRERLQGYLPTLKRHIQSGQWAHLETVPSLASVLLSSIDQDWEIKSAPEYIHNTYQYAYKWDCDQAILVSSTPELMVFYGVISKPSSIKLTRLKKLFAYAGVASLPLQNMSLARKKLFLQDGTGRIELNVLTNKLVYKNIVSGIPVAIIGKVSGARVNVEDVLFATPFAPEWPIPRNDGIEMVFVSGLYLGGKEVNSLALDLLQDYLLGLAGSAMEQEEIVAPRVRLFIVGNMISKSMYGQASTLENITSNCIKNVEKLDSFLEPIVRVMEVFLIPGENDLTFSSSLPQPPIHPALLPQSGSFQSLKRMTNPAKLQVSVSMSEGRSPPAPSDCSIMMDSSYAELLRGEVDFIDVVLQSGKNVRHTMEYCDISCPIEMGTNLLKWAHLHPTCCDTSRVLAEDLFSLKGSSPHVVVIGNLSEFRTEEFNGSKIIGLPSFQKSNTAVVFTKNFEVIPLSFKIL